MSITTCGRIASSFIRSRSVVPPARYCAVAMVGGTPAPSRLAAAWTAAARPSGRWYRKGRISSAPHFAFGPVDRLDDVRIGRASAQIAAHIFADIGVTAGMPFGNAADCREDLPRRAIAALERIPIDESLLHRVQRAAGFG